MEEEGDRRTRKGIEEASEWEEEKRRRKWGMENF
jgi:hypothetical protein